jgi:drug/metabolite transporter (DMT)-like permease
VSDSGGYARSSVLLVVFLGLLAAFLFAGAAALQQHAARRDALDRRHEPEMSGKPVVRPLFGLISRLVRNRMWLLGWLTNLAGFFVQAAALHLGSVALVQPLLVTQLLFALPMATAWSRRWPGALDWFGGGAITGALVVFLAVRGVAPLEGQADRAKVLGAALAAAAAVAVLVVLSRGMRAIPRATMLSVAAGLCFAMTAVFMKLTAADLLGPGVPATARDWPGYALALSTLTGLLLEQGAFATGSLSTAVAAMTITNPLASYAIGVLAFDVTPPTSVAALAALAGSGLLLIVGVVALSRSPSVRPDTGMETERVYSSGTATSESW